ncbi:helix-turn-helix domain-containing protein [Streptomyces sp. NPDC127190]|uniref:helix-turn-helix domain-containing protein n=1 Tax=unclassified Streptomyces TaxID=2593676 RepID=UPI00362C33C9
MSSAEGSSAGRGWLDPAKGFPDNVPARKRQLALKLRALCGLLRSADPDKPADSPLIQAEAAKRLGCTPDMLSRYLNRDRVPSWAFVERLYKEACADADRTDRGVGISREELLTLHASAAGERRGCEHCPDLAEQIESLTRQLNAPCPACMARQQEEGGRRRQLRRAAIRLRSARRDAARLRAVATDLLATLAEMRAERAEMQAAEAGLRERLAAALAARPPLPVPRRPGDRQRSVQDVSAARQLAAQAAELHGAGRDDLAFTLLHQSTTEVLTPAETALVVLELRQLQHGHLADDLIHVYGRDQEKQDVMAVALELHEEGAADDAGALLRAALG